MRLVKYLTAAVLIVAAAYLALLSDPTCRHDLACRAKAPAALTLLDRVGERLLASLPW